SLGFSHFLAKCTRGRDEVEFDHVNIREPHSALAYRMMADTTQRQVPKQFTKLPGTPQMLNALRNQVEQIQPETVVLASEAFSNFGEAAPSQIDRLLKAFPSADIQIYCALRRPDEYMISWHGQRIKVGEPVFPLRDVGMAPYTNNIHFNYDRALWPWITRAPDAKISVRSYDDILATGGSIEDFAHETGLDLLRETLPAGRHNKSLAIATFEIVRRANHELSAPDARHLRDYLLWHTGDLDLIPNRDIELFGPTHRAEIVERFVPIHRQLSEFVGKEEFFPGIEKIRDVKPIPEVDAVADTLRKLDPQAIGNPNAAQFLENLKDEYLT
ncbi:MAG: hypothetical protein OQK00_11695, partial [Rhodobacteraceae bacterium]|nr:hypothetical protein [Paracoccaceae bacterium]